MAHGHESSEKHGGGHNEWVGRKTKEAMGAGALNVVFGGAFLTALGIAFPPSVLAMLGLMGAGSYAIGARGKSAGGHH